MISLLERILTGKEVTINKHDVQPEHREGLNVRSKSAEQNIVENTNAVTLLQWARDTASIPSRI